MTSASTMSVRNNRHKSLDLIRGVIILAILIININYISTPTVVRYNPLAFGDFNWLDQWVWAFEYSLVKQRFMPILSLLFGAGIYLFAQKYERNNQSATKAFLQRSGALAVIGIAHAYLIWDGDILFAYAICGVFAYFLRNLSNKYLISLGILLAIAPLLPQVNYIIPLLGQNIDTPAFWTPDAQKVTELLSAYDGSWLSLTPARIETAIGRQTGDLIYFNLWRCTGLMLLGIALMRSGFLVGEGRYKNGLIISLVFGLPLSVIGTYYYIKGGYDYQFFSTVLTLCFYAASLLMAYAYLVAMIIWGKSNLFPKLQEVMSQVGRMALTLYISQNFICAFIFYGWGLGLYADVSRSGVMLITLVIIVIQVIFARLWFARFAQGPLESLWRRCYA